MRPRLALLAGPGVGVPAVIQQHEHHADAAGLADGQELVDAFVEALGPLAVRDVVEVHAQHVEADIGRPREFLVDRLGIERIGLPELELVDGGSRRVVAPDHPRLGCIPLGGLPGGPSLAGRGRAAQNQEQARGDEQITHGVKHRILLADFDQSFGRRAGHVADRVG